MAALQRLVNASIAALRNAAASNPAPGVSTAPSVPSSSSSVGSNGSAPPPPPLLPATTVYPSGHAQHNHQLPSMSSSSPYLPHHKYGTGTTQLGASLPKWDS
ncbi:hypothetical protein EON64_11090 [archaeon]|nr:MAG: hypothetical protein EON64_11090 [archaeon]